MPNYANKFPKCIHREIGILLRQSGPKHGQLISMTVVGRGREGAGSLGWRQDIIERGEKVIQGYRSERRDQS